MPRKKQGPARETLNARMSRTLEAVYTDPESVLNAQDGLLFVCALCCTTDKSCTHDPRRWCRRVYKGGTLLEECEQTIRAAEKNAIASCINCGQTIDPVYLANYPGAIVCAKCQMTTVRVGRSNGKSAGK